MFWLYRIRFILLVAVVLVMFLPGLGSLLLLDDYSNLIQNPKVQLSFSDQDFWVRAWFSGIAERSFSRQLSFLVFAIEHAVWGEFSPVKMKALNVVIHLVNGLLVYKLISLVLPQISITPLTEVQKKWFPTIAAFLWLISPGNVGSVLYVVQRMNLLSATCVLGALIVFFGFLDANNKLRKFSFLMISSGLITAGYLFKENAVLAVPFLLGLLWLKYSDFKIFSGEFNWVRWSLIVVPFSILALFIYAISGDAIQLFDLFANRNYGMLDRLLTQPYALFMYLGYAILPIPGRIRFYHDYLVDNAYFSIEPFNWILIPSLLVLLSLVAYAIFVRKSYVVYFTFGWFFIFHALESSFLPLEPAYNHRNYLPSVGIFVGVVLLLFISYNSLKSRISALAAKSVIGGIVLAFATTTLAESFKWGNTFVFLSSEAEQYPISSRAAYSRGNWIFRNDLSGIYCDQLIKDYELVEKYHSESIFGPYGKILWAFRCHKPEAVVPAMETISERLKVAKVPVDDVVVLDSLSYRCREDEFKAMGLQCEHVAKALEGFLQRPEAKFHKNYTGLRFLDARMAYARSDFSVAQEKVLKVLELNPTFDQAHILMLDIHYAHRRCKLLEDSLDKYQETKVKSLRTIPGQVEGRYDECDI